MQIFHLLIGTNLGDRQANLTTCIRLIEQKIGHILQHSKVYESAAWGLQTQPDFLNQALAVETELSPEEVLKIAKLIENEMGRAQTTKWASRLIDVDLLLCGELVMETDALTLPHPHLHERNFALIPLMEIAPEFVHPVFEKTIEDLYMESNDLLEVWLLD